MSSSRGRLSLRWHSIEMKCGLLRTYISTHCNVNCIVRAQANCQMASKYTYLYISMYVCLYCVKCEFSFILAFIVPSPAPVNRWKQSQYNTQTFDLFIISHTVLLIHRERVNEATLNEYQFDFSTYISFRFVFALNAFGHQIKSEPSVL